jgi:hypothetical protein
MALLLHVLPAAAHALRLAALDVSADGRALVAAGCDGQGRQVIALWDISGIRQGARVSWRLAGGSGLELLHNASAIIASWQLSFHCLLLLMAVRCSCG